MLNKAMIIGRLGRDPELRYTQSGVPMTTLSVATGETYIDREGNKNEVTEWHRVSVFQRQAENCVRYLRKGSLVYVEGSLQTRKWQDQQGQERSATVIRAMRVTFLERRSDMAREGYNENSFAAQSEGHEFDASSYQQQNATQASNQNGNNSGYEESKFAQPEGGANVSPSESMGDGNMSAGEGQHQG
ncbi:MAG: single-stranded DNA-binding protein [Desulfovibrionaceae bacterium]|nr:single-stranded DNA-binding protein [Desulfovibrionaceae bacterium]